MDECGYPEEDELQAIEKWRLDDPTGLIEFIRERWKYADCDYFKLTGKRVLRLELHTGGWSGNEDIIGALRKNMFWFFWWEKSTRGGHYVFRVNSGEV